MKTMTVIAAMMLAGASLTASAGRLVNSHGQTLPDARDQKVARAPKCCFTKAIVKQLPGKGVSVELKKACEPGCTKPCVAGTR